MMSRDIFPKVNFKLASRQNGDGNEAEVEVRENEEQTHKYQKIIDLLVAAGYFRALIKGLSPFDKVVGGMTWCIELCNIDIDVDLLFQENSTIGQKIALTEKIVAVLPKMKCPYGIEPHQIQGLDFIHIFPVIQWLIKTSMEFRFETFEFVRANAINQFNKAFTPLDEEKLNENLATNIKSIRDVYRPKRQYRLKQAPPTNPIERVEVTLLEYGTNQSKAIRLQEEVTDEVILTSEDKVQLLKHYSVLQNEIKNAQQSGHEERQLAKLDQQKSILIETSKKISKRKMELENEIKQLEVELNEVNSLGKEAIKRLEAASPTEDVTKLEDLIVMNELLREQELGFKEQCRQELDELQIKIESAKDKNETKPISSELINKVDSLKLKIQESRLLLAKKNRTIAAFQRQLDDIPTRAELAQYQRRFLELYNQVAAKHKETKQYFTLYNTLNDSKVYITKELSLLNSICDIYPEAMESSSGKENLLLELTRIVETVKQNKLKVEARFNEEQKRRDLLSNELQVLIGQQRKYAQILRQLSIEYKRNEALMAAQVQKSTFKA